MNVRITHTKREWDYKTQDFVPHTYSVSANGLNKTEIKSLVRFMLAGMTSGSVGRTKLAVVNDIVDKAEQNGSYQYDDGSYNKFNLEIVTGG